jgi:hemolysin activation/secretion protein
MLMNFLHRCRVCALSLKLALLVGLGAAVTPFVAAQTAAVPLAATSVTAPAEEARFDILEFAIEGNTVLSVEDIERAVLPYLGEQKLIQDVESARKALEEVYQRRGFQTVFVDVPEQRVNSGLVSLRVLEGRVERLQVTGNRYFTQGVIKNTVPALAQGSVPDFNVVQTQLTNLNRVADRQVTPVLKSGRTPGTVDVELVVKDQLPVHGEFEINNRSSAFTSESRVAAGVRWDNLWQRQHSLGLSVQLSPEQTDEVKVLVGNYLWRFAEQPDALAFYAVRSDSKVALVGSSTVLGNATIAGARWVKPITAAPGSTNLFQSLTLGLDYKKFGQTNIATATQEIDVLGPLSYVPLSLAYNATRAGAGQSLQWGVSVLTAPRGLLGNTDSEFQSRRALARAGWAVFKLEAAHERALSERTSAWFKVEGQWVDEPLVSNEQLTMGGAESVRGYREAELAGDRGGRGSVELRWWPWRVTAAEFTRRAQDAAANSAQDATPSAFSGGANAAGAGGSSSSAGTGNSSSSSSSRGAGAVVVPDAPSLLSAVQLYALLDAGAVETVRSQGAQVPRRLIAGVGSGLRWAANGWRAQLEAAQALKPGGNGLNGAITEKGDWRVHVRLGLDF